MPLPVTFALVAATSNLPALPATTTLQQDFDTASAAAEAGDCSTAVPLFEALERRPGFKPASLSGAAVVVRKGNCLIRLGHPEDGEKLVVAGLPRLERAGSTFDTDVALAYKTLGDVAFSRNDYGLAKERYGKARALKVPAVQMSVLAGLVKVSSFDAGPEPLAYADEGLRLGAAQKPVSKDNLASFHTLRARILLNRGETDAAYTELKQALDLSGGLTSRTTLSEASMRGDLALAAMLLNRKDDARKYLAYTGAGRIDASPFATAVSMSPPECGEETGLRPQDFAVVEFGIGDDGAVTNAQTVYSRGGASVATAFARAVKDWYWRPEGLAKIPAFYRIATRVELRCTTAGGPAPGLLKPLSDRFEEWAMPRLGLSGIKEEAALISALRSRVADAQSQDAAGQIAAIGMLTFVDPRINADSVAMLDRALSLSTTASVPNEAITTLRVLRLLTSPFAKVRGNNARLGKFDKQNIATLLQDPVVNKDPIAADTLRLLSDEGGNEPVRAAAEDGRLPEHHPLRQLAYLTLANRAAATGDLASAQGFFARTGLTEQQCALIGPKPVMRRSGADSSDFPKEAMMYGFEGWVRLEFDITSDGSTANARPVIAYPPFVFVDAAQKMTRGIRYQASYRPAGGMACNANGETIRFILP